MDTGKARGLGGQGPAASRKSRGVPYCADLVENDGRPRKAGPSKAECPRGLGARWWVSERDSSAKGAERAAVLTARTPFGMTFLSVMIRLIWWWGFDCGAGGASR